jgi:hypothetical protein
MNTHLKEDDQVCHVKVWKQVEHILENVKGELK